MYLQNHDLYKKEFRSYTLIYQITDHWILFMKVTCLFQAEGQISAQQYSK